MATLSVSNKAKPNRFIWISLLIFQVTVVSLYALELQLFSILPILVVLFFFFVSDFRYCLYLFIFSLFLGQNLFPASNIKIADLILVILILSYFAKGALRGDVSLLKTPLDKAILVFLSVLGISLVNVVDLSKGITNFSRHIQLFALFYVIQSELKGNEVRKFLRFFLLLAMVHSIYNLYFFVSYAGKIRSFGIAGVPFADMLVASLIISYSFYLFQKNNLSRLKYAAVFFILLGALFATQTRGAMMSFSLSYTFVSIITLTLGRKVYSSIVCRNFWKLAFSLAVFLLLAVHLFGSLVTDLTHRFYSLYQLPVTGGQETIQLRFHLWETALKAFLAYPFLGIGIGQFRVVHLIIPNLRFSPLFPETVRLDAHNIVLSYLSEAGLLGLCSLLYFMISFLRLGWGTYKGFLNKEDLPILTSLLGILFFVFVSSFYAGAWFYGVNGMTFMFFLALTVVFHRTQMMQGQIRRFSKFAE
jgi:O-antigen ligase